MGCFKDIVEMWDYARLILEYLVEGQRQGKGGFEVG